MRPIIGICPESIDILRSSTAQQVIKRVPASQRAVLISMEQLTPSTGDTRHQVTTTEFAAKMARMEVDERRRMLTEEQDLRMLQFDTMAPFYAAMMRNDNKKYPGVEGRPAPQPLPGFRLPGTAPPTGIRPLLNTVPPMKNPRQDASRG